MIPTEHFHHCHSCGKFVIDLERRRLSLDLRNDEDIPSDIFFFDATLQDVINGLVDGCELCVWLDSLWAGSSSSICERYGMLKAGENASRIPVCAETFSMSLVDRYPVDEVVFFGLWERDVALLPRQGRCRVFAQCSVDVFTPQGDAADRLIQNRPINRFPGSAGSLRLTRQWLENCQNSHPKCKGVSQTYMPLRVLHIRDDGCGSCDFHVTLKVTTGKPIEPFAALSYCWGGDQPYKTTTARMQSGNMSLKWRKLPRSIQDAIKTAAALGLRYLWADSLCIIQDDEEDKTSQIADMARIYSQATVTIIASRARRSVDGFLGEIDLASQTRLAVRLPIRCPDESQAVVGWAYLTHIEGSRGSSEPIDSRAWTLQERYLSNRVLDFGSRQTRWTCAMTSALASPPTAVVVPSGPASAGESYTDGWKWDKNPEDHTSQIMYLHGDLLADLAVMAAQRSSAAWIREWLHGRWHTVLSEYTPRLLSLPTDRILGISGVAEIFLAHLRGEGRDEGERYLAGMWGSSLPASLCWHAAAAVADERVGGGGAAAKSQGASDAERRPGLPPRPERYQGPSWSWAGVNCHVLFIYSRACQRDCQAVLLGADVRLANAAARCGSVTRGVLTLRARMRRSLWHAADGTLHVEPGDNGDTPGGVASANDTRGRKLQLAVVYPDSHDPLGISSKEYGPQVPVWLLEVGNCVGFKKRGPVGLIVQSRDSPCGRGPTRFRRVGLFHVNAKQPKGSTEITRHSTDKAEWEAELNLFEGHMARTIELE
ncbi:putative HET domain-containing protein [Rosellinia necatrix]|uniref:Putative HET domain-containing protein n=1 Tax=Rosellinia necatrix TaxID=77044 RepID=A0A1S8ABD6_ROSNE|nr:putative HET domain-containing protein [Rosellinia necatrix]